MRRLDTGSPLPEWRFDGIDAEALRRMAVVLDDPNPIHLDPAAVAAVGLGDRTINQGPSNVGYVLNMLAGLAPGADVERLSVRFLANVFAGDRVVAGGVVDERTDAEDGSTRLDCRVWLDTEPSARALEGRAVVRLPAGAGEVC